MPLDRDAPVICRAQIQRPPKHVPQHREQRRDSKRRVVAVLIEEPPHHGHHAAHHGRPGARADTGDPSGIRR